MSKYIGDVSAYAYAVSKGYTGTEEEFAELMASYADVGQTAADAKDAAVAAKTAAQTAATTATNKASEATTAAQTATTKAGEAQTSAQTASSKASEASQSASTASTKASESAQSASQASGYAHTAETAKTDAQTAKTQAETARDGAVTAKNDAESARDEAQNIVDGINAKAEQIDTNTADITELESTKADLSELYKAFPTDTASGAIASFSDGADDLPLKSLVVDINPVQDLHGQDAPYPAGGGKNKIEIPTFINGYCAWSSAPKNETDLLSEINKLPIGDYVISGEFELTERNDTSDSSRFGITFFYGGTLSQYIGDNSIRWENIGVGGVKTFETAVSITSEMAGTFTAVRLYGCGMSGAGATGKAKINKLQVEEGSTATSYAPYSNICPISGWTGANVKRTGKNLLNPEKFAKCTTDGNGVFTFSQVGYTANLFTGQNGTSHVIDDLSKCLVLPAGTYTYSVLTVSGSPITDIYSVDDDGVRTSIVRASGTDNYFTATFTLTEQTRICLIRPNNTSPTVFKEPQIEVGSNATEYVPYQGTTLPVNWQTEAGTVYGGKLDVLSGELTIDRAMVDMGKLAWTGNGTDSVYTSMRTNKLIGGDNCVCSALAKVAQGTQVSSMSDATFKTYANSVDVAVKLSGITWQNAQTMLSGFQFVYPLATPITVTLTPNELSTLFGVNNIWADSGDTEVEYRADTKLFIERLTAPDSVDMIADANITSGQYFMVGNSLYKATANIANGGQIIVGTNATRVSLAQALNEINA